MFTSQHHCLSTMAARPAPYSIAFGALVSLHSQEERSPLYDDIKDVEERLHAGGKVDAFLQECLLASQRMMLSDWRPSPTLRVWLRHMQASLGREMTRIVHGRLKEATTSIQHRMDLKLDLQRSMTNGRVDAESANGIYLRSICLGFADLSFESVSLLWKDFHTQVMDAESSLKDDDNEENEYANVGQDHAIMLQQWPLSPEQMEDALQYEIRHGTTRNRLKNGNENAIYQDCRQDCGSTNRQYALRKILEHNPELPSAHFLHFTQALEAGERDAAINALHPFLDYALVSKGEPEILQFAAILAASMHRRFGDAAMSLAATEEVVRVAQQSQDAACVAFSLGWLSLHENNPVLAEELIRRCVQRATEGNLTSLAAGANLMLARMSMNVRAPGVAWTHLLEATADETTPSVDTGAGLDRPTRMNHVKSGENALQILARQRMVAAGIWDAVGQTSLSALSSLTALKCHYRHLSSEDVALAIQNIARSSSFGFAAEAPTEGLEVCLKSSFNQSGRQLDLEMVECIYGQAIRKLISLRIHFKLPVHGIFLPEIGLLLHEWAVRRGDYGHAELLLDTLLSTLCPRLANYEEVKVDVLTQKCFLLSRQERWEEAKRLAAQLIETCHLKQLRNQHAYLLLLLSKIHLDACPRQFTNVLPSLFECLNVADAYQIDGLHAAASALLAEVHLRMNNPKRAIALLRAAFPSILQHEGVWVQAEAYLTLAKSNIQEGMATSPSKRVKLLEKASQTLLRSEELFVRCHDRMRLREVLYLQARVYNELPDSLPLRDEASGKFIRISQSVEQGQRPCHDGFLNAVFDLNKLAKIVSRTLTTDLLAQ